MSHFSYKRAVKKDPIRDWMESQDPSYETFITGVNLCIDEIVRNIEENNIKRIADGEDRLTDEIKVGLRQKNLFDAVEHDAQTGGHTDLVIRLDPFVWKAESKILGGRQNYDVTWVEKGFVVLTSKYSHGTQFDLYGCMLIYVKKPNMKKCMDEWKNHLLQTTPNIFSIDVCTYNPLSFISTHEHNDSGLMYQVRHVPVCVYDATKPLKDH